MNKRTKRFLSLFVAAAMFVTGFTGLPEKVQAAEAAKTVDVFVTAQAENAFLTAPKELTVSADLAESYGYTDEVTDGVSALDVLVAEHQQIFGDAFTPQTASDSLVVGSSGWITKIFGTETSAVSFAVNGLGVYDKNSTYNPSYGYTGYTISQSKVSEGDKVDFFLYQDASDYLDNYGVFENGNEQLVVCGNAIELTLKGYPYAYCNSMNEEDIAKQTTAIEDAKLGYVDASTGAITPIDGVTTNEEGKATLTISEAGTYYVTAYVPSEDVTENYATPLIMPLFAVRVLEEADYNAVQPVIEKINAIGTVENTAESAAKIQTAHDAYNALTEDQKAAVVNYKVLAQAELAFKANVSADVFVTAQADGAFLTAPQEFTVNADLAEQYHFTDQVATGVSALDVLVQETILIYGADQVTPDTIGEYLAMSSSKWGGLMVSTIFKQDTSANGYVVNGVSAPVTVEKQQIVDDDIVEYYIYQDKTGYSDKYSSFDAFTKSVKRGVALDVTLMADGYDASWNIVKSPVADASLAYVDAKTGAATAINDVKTDSNGKASVTFDKEGTYILTATSTATTLVQPVMIVTVTANPQLDEQEEAKANVAYFNNSTAALEKASYVYTGKEIKPAVTVKNGNTTLKNGTDYTVSYTANKNVGTATVTVKGAGKYAAATAKKLTFKITAKKISTASFSKVTDKVLTGKEIKPSVTVKDGSKTLKNGTDYKISYSSNKKVGTAKITITGKGNYTGTKTISFKIKPVAAVKVKAASTTYDSIKLSWNKASGAKSYTIYRAASKNGKYTKLATVKTTSYTNKKLTAGKTWYYKVKASGTLYSEKYTTADSNIVSAKAVPAKPVIKLSAGKKKATVTWNKISGAGGYEVYRATSKNGKYTKAATVKAGKTTYTDAKLKAKKTYYYKVRAYKTVKGKKVYTGYSSVGKTTTKK